MKKYISKLSTLMILVLGLMASSCSDDEIKDTTDPTATFTSPIESAVYSRGQSMICNAVFEDDIELLMVEINIYSQKSTKGWDTPWIYNETVYLSGKTDELSAYQIFNQDIPLDIMSGQYTLEFKVFDKTLNYSSYQFDISIE